MNALDVVRYHEECVGLRLAGFPHQRAFLKTLAREPLEGAEREAFAELFGFEADRPIPEPARRVVLLLKGARCGGTLLCSNYGLFRALTADLSYRRRGERVFVGFTGADIRHAREALAQVGATLDRMPSIASLVLSRSTEKIELRRPDGRVVVFQCLPATRSAARGRWFVCVIVTEADYLGGADGAAPAQEIVRAYAARLLSGGVLLGETTPWLADSYWHRAYLSDFGKPTSTLVCRAPTLTFYNTAETRELVAGETARDPQNAAREYACTWIENGDAYLDGASIDRCVDKDGPLILEHTPGAATCIGFDAAFTRDGFGVVAVQAASGGHVDVAQVEVLVPRPGAPLIPSEAWALVIRVAKSYGATTAFCDGHALPAAKEALGAEGISVVAVGQTGQSKTEIYTRLREAIHGRKLGLPPSGPIVGELKNLTSRTRPGGGLSIDSPRRPGSHGDTVSALAAALHGLSSRTGADALHSAFVDINARFRAAGVRWGNSGY